MPEFGSWCVIAWLCNCNPAGAPVFPSRGGHHPGILEIWKKKMGQACGSHRPPSQAQVGCRYTMHMPPGCFQESHSTPVVGGDCGHQPGLCTPGMETRTGAEEAVSTHLGQESQTAPSRCPPMLHQKDHLLGTGEKLRSGCRQLTLGCSQLAATWGLLGISDGGLTHVDNVEVF